MKAELLSGRQQSLIVSIELEEGNDADRGVPKQLSAPARAAALDEHVAGTPFADSEELAGVRVCDHGTDEVGSENAGKTGVSILNP